MCVACAPCGANVAIAGEIVHRAMIGALAVRNGADKIGVPLGDGLRMRPCFFLGAAALIVALLLLDTHCAAFSTLTTAGSFFMQARRRVRQFARVGEK